MKRVLFYYDNYCGEGAKGGTEVATFRIACALKETGKVEAYNAYRSKAGKGEGNIYRREIKLSGLKRNFEKELSEFIKKNEIDVVVNMGKFFRHASILNAIEKSGRDVKTIFMHHFAPGSEMKKGSYQAGIHLLKLNPLNPLYWIRASLYPLIKLSRNVNYPRKYKEVYDRSDRVVLLSEGFMNEYAAIGNVEGKDKFVAIPNIYEVPSQLREQYSEKRKRVLILSRMDEVQKRLSVALRIWAEIEENPPLKEWELDIVGSGHNNDIVKRLSKKLGLKRAKFHGWQSGIPFLQRDSILLSTSDYEGLPLSFLEAKSYGCIPVAINNYASLNDIVKDGETGLILEKDSKEIEMAKKIGSLMLDDTLRGKIAEECRKDLGKFTSEKIAEEWLKILI